MRIHWRSLTFWIFVGLFAGLACGAVFGERIVPLGDTLGTLFLRLLRMAIMPLIVASITSAVISVGSRQNLGILGAQTFGWQDKPVSSHEVKLTGKCKHVFVTSFCNLHDLWVAHIELEA